MTEHDKTSKEFQSIAAAQRINDLDPAIGAFYQQNDDQLGAAEHALLGDDGYQRLQDFNHSEQARGIVDDVASLVALTPTPLTYSQASQLVPILATASTQNPNGSPDPSEMMSIDWQKALAQAAGFLSARQLTALKTEAQLAHVQQLISQFYQLQRGAE